MSGQCVVSVLRHAAQSLALVRSGEKNIVLKKVKGSSHSARSDCSASSKAATCRRK